MNTMRITLIAGLLSLLFASGLVAYFALQRQQAAAPVVQPATTANDGRDNAGLSEEDAQVQLKQAATRLRELGYSSDDLNQLLGSTSADDESLITDTPKVWVLGTVFLLVIILLGVKIGLRAVWR